MLIAEVDEASSMIVLFPGIRSTKIELGRDARKQQMFAVILLDPIYKVDSRICDIIRCSESNESKFKLRQLLRNFANTFGDFCQTALEFVSTHSRLYHPWARSSPAHEH